MNEKAKRPESIDVWGHDNNGRYEAHTWGFFRLDGVGIYRCAICGMKVDKSDLKKQTDK